jgi:hypothetical protein
MGAASPGDDDAGGGDAGDPGEADDLPGDTHRPVRYAPWRAPGR